MTLAGAFSVPLAPWLAALSLIAALLYPAIAGTGTLRALVKASAVGALALWAVELQLMTLAATLALAAVGDFALARPGTRAFLIGMAAFALAHLGYGAIFLSLGAPVMPDPFPLMAMGLIVVAALWLGPLFARGAGALSVPVLIYVTIIALMGLLVLALPPGRASAIAALGAVLFMISDAIIGQQRFTARRWRGQDLAIWGLYYAGQLSLFAGIVMQAGAN